MIIFNKEYFFYDHFKYISYFKNVEKFIICLKQENIIFEKSLKNNYKIL